MQHLEMPIPGYLVDKWVEVELSANQKMTVKGIDVDGHPVANFKYSICTYHPFKDNQEIDLFFHGHFKEN